MKRFNLSAFLSVLLSVVLASSVFGDVLVDDFTYGYTYNKIGTYWGFYADEFSTITAPYYAARDADSCARMNFALKTGSSGPYASMSISFDNAVEPVDLTGATAVQFDIRGSKPSMTIYFLVTQLVNDNYTTFYAAITATDSWSTKTVTLSGLPVASGDDPFQIDELTGLSWSVSAASPGPGDTGTIYLDNVKIIGTPAGLHHPYAPYIWRVTLPTVNWFHSDEATSYRLQVSVSDAFASTEVDESSVADTFYSLPASVLTTGTKYYWRVNATDGAATSRWSWIGNYTPYTVSFNKNDGGASGTMGDQMIASGYTVSLSANGFTKEGWTFSGWATTDNGTVAYADEANYTMGTANVTLYAKWTANPYSITFDKNDAGASGSMSSQTIACGSTASLSSIGFSKPGWSFTGWATTSDGNVAYTDGANYTMGTANVTLYAKWTVNSYTVTFDKNDGTATGSMTPQMFIYESSAPLTANAFTKTGWTFQGWATAPDGAVTLTDGASYTMGAANVTLYAKWTANDYSVTFDKNDGEATGSMSNQTIACGSTAPLSGNGFSKAGWAFTGWATAADGAVAYTDGADYVMGTADVTLFAHWEQLFTVTYDGNGSESGTVPATASYISGATVTVAGNTGTLTRTGFTFAGWNTAADGSATTYSVNNTFTMGTENVTLYAKWTSNPTYTVTYDGNNSTSGSVPTDPNNYLQDDAVTVLANSGNLAKDGSTFEGWNTAADGSGTDYAANATFTMGSANVTLYAKWTLNTYTITFDKNDADATGTMSAQSILFGSEAALTANGFDKAGWAFAGWTTESDGTVAYADEANFTMGSSDVTLYAKWTVNTYTITFDKNDTDATGTMTKQSIASGSSADLTANGFAKSGSTFAGWATASDGEVVYEDESDYTMGTANITLYAKWALIPTYTVTYDGNGNTAGSAPTDEHRYQQGDSVTAPGAGESFVKSGSTFAGWNTAADGSGTTVAADAKFAMGSEDITLYAQWPLNTYTLTVNRVTDDNPAEEIGDTTITHGDTVHITADSIDGYIFAKWQVTSGEAHLTDSTSHSSSIILTNGDAEVTAVYDVFLSVNSRSAKIPTRFGLSGNGKTGTITFAIPKISGHSRIPVKIRLFDVRGQSLGVIIDKTVSPGYYTAPIGANRKLAAAMIICKMESLGFRGVVKLITK